MSKYFSSKEIACPCCGEWEVSSRLMDMLDRARGISGVPYVVTSGYRCPDYNREIGGAEGSSHTFGEAVDIRARDSDTRYKVLSGLVQAGFVRIGIYDMHLHADVSDRDSSAVWLGSSV